LIVGDSRQKLNGLSYGFALIDGDHSFEGVLADIVTHWDAVVPLFNSGKDALVAFHDAIPNDGLKYRYSGRKAHRLFLRLKNRFRSHPKPENPLNFFLGVYCVCRQLIESGAAEEFGRAGSLWIMRKKTELPGTFSDDCHLAWKQLQLNPPLESL
jgi:hypothetical protein